MDKFEKSRQLLSTSILKNFVGRITGAGLDRIVGSNPENVLMVGKLMSTNDVEGKNTNSSKTFIESIGIDFYISEKDLEHMALLYFPTGGGKTECSFMAFQEIWLNIFKHTHVRDVNIRVLLLI